MKFGIAKQRITPDYPVFLAGFGGRDHKSEGVLDDIYATVTLIKADQDQKLVIITLDALGGDRSFVRGIQSALKEEFGFERDQILINFSHTHCSVYLTGDVASYGRRGGYSMGQDRWPEQAGDLDYSVDIRYFLYLRDTIIQLTKHCLNSLKEGTILLKSGTSDAGVSRRMMTEDGMKFWPNFTADTDKDLFVMQLIGTDGRTQGLLFSYACHPTCIGKHLISAEFVGKACTELEQLYPGSIAVFLQGCAADIKPVKTVDHNLGRFKAITVEEMYEAGVELANDVQSVVESGGIIEVQGKLRTRMDDVRLFTEPWKTEQVAAIANDETLTDFKRRAARRVLNAIQDGNVREILPQYIQHWKLGEQIRIVTLEGEVPAEYALKIKRMLGKDGAIIIVLGYSNGVSTYIPTAKILQEGGYEADAFILHGFRGPLVPENESIILGTLAASNTDDTS
jgi:hypothetical protein